MVLYRRERDTEGFFFRIVSYLGPSRGHHGQHSILKGGLSFFRLNEQLYARLIRSRKGIQLMITVGIQ